MTSLTLTINDSAAHKAQLAAQRRRTTVDALVEGLIERLEIEDLDAGNRACEVPERSFQEVSTPFGGKLWKNREELFDR